MFCQRLFSYNAKYFMSKRMGRPPKPKAEIRKPALSVRLNKAELAAVENTAKSAGLGLSAWAQKTLLQAAGYGSV
jgi:hypothetical protein